MTQSVIGATPRSEPLPRSVYGWLLLLSLFAVLLIYGVTSKYGAALSYDSGAYVSFARSVATGQGFVDWGGWPISLWAPAYSIIVAFGMVLTGQEPIVVMRALAALAYGITIFVSGYYLFRWIGHRSYFAWFGSLVITISVANQNAFVWALTEPVFITAVLVFLVGLERYLTTGWRGWWAVALVAVWLATLTRYIGVTTLVPVAALALLLWEKGSLTRRLRNAAFFAVLGVLPIGAWLVRNYLATGNFTGERPDTVAPLLQHIGVAFRNIARWFVPLDPYHVAKQFLVGGFALGIIGLLVLATVVLIWRRHRALSAFGDADARPMSLLWLFVCVYLVVLVVLAIPTRLSTLEDRLLIPTFIPLMLLIFGMSHFVWTSFPLVLGRRVVQSGIVLLMVWLLGFNSVAATLEAQNKLRSGAGGYSRTEWQESALVAFLKSSVPTGYSLYSNDNMAVYLFTDRPTLALPSRINIRYGSTDGTWVKGNWPEYESYIVWFNSKGLSPSTLSPDEVLPQVESRVLFEAGDGSIYYVQKVPGQDP